MMILALAQALFAATLIPRKGVNGMEYIVLLIILLILLDRILTRE